MPIDIQFNEHLPGMMTWQTMTQEELLQKLEDDRKLEAVKRLRESGINNPVISKMERMGTKANDEAIDDMVSRYRKQGVFCSAKVMIFDGTRYVVAYA